MWRKSRRSDESPPPRAHPQQEPQIPEPGSYDTFEGASPESGYRPDRSGQSHGRVKANLEDDDYQRSPDRSPRLPRTGSRPTSSRGRGKRSDSNASSQAASSQPPQPRSGSLGGPLPAQPRSGTTVLINLYDLGTALQVINGMLPSGLGIVHAAVEAYNYEWSFAYLGESSNENPEDPSSARTGVLQCRPRKLSSYMFRESLEVGRTIYSEDEVKQIVRRLCFDWRSSSYHITRRNCIEFCEALVSKLGLAATFPAWLKTVYDASNGSPILSALADAAWASTKWTRIGSRYASQGPTSSILCAPFVTDDQEEIEGDDPEKAKDPVPAAPSQKRTPDVEVDSDSDNETVFNAKSNTFRSRDRPSGRTQARRPSGKYR